MIEKSNFIGTHIENIEKYYKFLKELGRGSYGTVFRIQNIATGEIYACKKLDKKFIKNKNRINTEINLLKATDHPNIVKLYEIYEDITSLYLVMEECNGGELFQRLVKNAKNHINYTEKEAAKIMKQIFESVNYLHSHGVCHRDLKPENILFSSMSENFQIKLIDFGLSKVWKENNKIMKGSIGTLYYMAPEVIYGRYNEKCDVWSCGVILYMLLCGLPPFFSLNEKELKRKILNFEYNFNYKAFDKISDEAKNLISKIFVMPDERPSISELLNSNWIKENAPNSNNEISNIDFIQIKKYCKLNLVQKSIINFSAFHLSSNETEEFVKLFKNIDKNNDGVITFDELQKGISILNLRIKQEDLIKIFKETDIDKNGLINYTEFISTLIDYENSIKEDKLIECFKKYDADNSGKINFMEFCEIIKPQNEKEKQELRDLFNQFDINKDGEIDINEFIDGYKKL